MFSTLGLFREVGCPDAACARAPCLFSHDPAVRAASTAPSASGAKVVRPDVTSSLLGKRKVSGSVEPPARRPTPAKTNGHGIITGSAERPKLNAGSAGGNGSPVAPGRAGSSQKASDHAVAPPVKKAPNAAPPGMAPMLMVNTKLSKQPIIDRRKALQRLFEEFSKLYIHIYPSYPDLAGQHAIEQELSIAAATNKATYHSNVQSALISIRGRTKPESFDSPFAGTVAASAKKVTEVEARKASQLTRKRLKPYLLPLDEYAKWGYMLKVPDAPGATEPDAVGQIKTCDRCRVDFTVSDAVNYATMSEQREKGECIFHWGRPMPIRQDGRKLWVYSCCREPRGSEGCTDGLHVFKDGDARGLDASLEDMEKGDLALHKRVDFKEIEDVERDRSSEAESRTQDVVAMDCEMIYTTAGLSLARVTVIAEDGRTIFDECVRQEHTILDLNTKFSGLRMSDLDAAALDIRGVRKALCSFIGPKTVIIGHGLENDLKATRIVHHYVVDTAVLFPHHKGAPYRRSLKDLTSEKLGVFIQTSILDEGHDSGADAKAALDLVKWKVVEDDKRTASKG